MCFKNLSFACEQNLKLNHGQDLLSSALYNDKIYCNVSCIGGTRTFFQRHFLHYGLHLALTWATANKYHPKRSPCNCSPHWFAPTPKSTSTNCSPLKEPSLWFQEDPRTEKSASKKTVTQQRFRPRHEQQQHACSSTTSYNSNFSAEHAIVQFTSNYSPTFLLLAILKNSKLMREAQGTTPPTTYATFKARIKTNNQTKQVIIFTSLTMLILPPSLQAKRVALTSSDTSRLLTYVSEPQWTATRKSFQDRSAAFKGSM